MRIEFTIPGEPVAKARPKFFRRGTHVGTYTPAQSRRFEERVRFEADAALYKATGRRALVALAGVPVSITARFYFLKPMCRVKKKTQGQDFPRVVKPDGDNLEKSLCDGIKGILCRDDAQIWECHWQKWEVDSRPRVEVAVEVQEAK